MLGISLEDAKAGLEILGILTTFGAGFVMLKMRATFVTRNDFGQYEADHADAHDALEARLAKGEKHFSELQAVLVTLASAAQVNEVRLSVARVEGDVNALEERINGHNEVSLRNERLLRTLHDHLLNGRIDK